jgi:hypothetical protein
MRLCALRGAFAASQAADSFVLHDPRAWLGTAFHKVMEVASRPGATEAGLEQAWTTAVTEAGAVAASHSLDARYAAPDRWPGYFLVRQRALASGQRIVAGKASGNRKAGSVHGSPASGVSTERLLLARDGRLAGRLDRFDGRVLTEYKSLIPDVTWRGAAAILEGYRRQLRLYAAIIAETLGRWPEEGRIVAASGQVMEVSLDPRACEAEANNAIVALDSLNQQLAAGTPASALAQPGEQACGACRFRALCPTFWRWLARASSSGLPEISAAGVLDRIELGLDGDLYTAYLSVHQQGVSAGIQPIVLRRSIHGDLTASARGAFWRIISAQLKSDGRLRADASTCVFELNSLPSVVTARTSASAL